MRLTVGSTVIDCPDDCTLRITPEGEVTVTQNKAGSGKAILALPAPTSPLSDTARIKRAAVEHVNATQEPVSILALSRKLLGTGRPKIDYVHFARILSDAASEGLIIEQQRRKGAKRVYRRIVKRQKAA